MMDEQAPCFTGSPGAFCGCQPGRAGVNKSSAVSFLVDALEINDKLGRVMFGEREHLGAKEGDDVIRDDGWRFVLEVGVVDAEVQVEPVDLVGGELAGDETLAWG